jgi:hypothetical protein
VGTSTTCCSSPKACSLATRAVPPRTVVLDNEAVQVLTTGGHPKRGKMLAHFEVIAKHRARVLVPVAVRVEAGWDRRSPGAADANRLPVLDMPLTVEAANVAARLVDGISGLSVADASVGAVLAQLADKETPVVVLSSDRSDMERIAAWLNVRVTVGLV